MSSDMDIFNVQNVGAAATIATAVGSFIVFLVKRPWRKKIQPQLTPQTRK